MLIKQSLMDISTNGRGERMRGKIEKNRVGSQAYTVSDKWKLGFHLFENGGYYDDLREEF